MCGIAGFVRRDPGSAPPLLSEMQRAIAHRGPDDSGTWHSAHCHAAFAHARLAIIDPSPAGHQPMAVTDGRFTITYNGEIYNFAALRSALITVGATFRSNSDTEVILRLYEAEGPAFVTRLRGMFAFAIWDEVERVLFLARDRFGIKPLYFHDAGGVLTFASEVRALLAAGVPATVDATAAYQYFRTGSVPEPLTLVKGVCALEAGHCLTWRAGEARTHQYWDVHFPDANPIDDAVAVTRAALLDSVEHHFVSDVPVGVFLSGGLDSTAIVALARRFRGGELRSFSLTFPGLPQDEGDDARRTAEHFGTSHYEWAIDGATARPLVDEFLAGADQPSIDGFNTFLVARLARRHDTKVVLSGLGGDEVFGGYPSFWRVPRLAKIRRLAAIGGGVSVALARRAGMVGGHRARRLPDLLALPADLPSAYSVYRGIYTRDEASTLTSHYVGEGARTDDAESQGANAPTPADGVSRLELTRYMRNQLLRDADVTSMASGVEVRVPFVDPVLFDVVSRIPAARRLQRGKALLQAAVPELPSWVVNRPKRGFMLPFGAWLDRDWRGHLGEIHPPPAISMDTWYRRWSVVAFERWLQRVRPQNV